MKSLLLFLVVIVGCKAQEYTGVDGSGPHFVTQPVDTTFNEDSNIRTVHLDCEAEGDARPTYTWRHINKTGSPKTVNPGSGTRYQLSRGQLSIMDPDREVDEGSFQCLASNQIGTIMSSQAKLEFAYLLPFPQEPPEVQRIPLNKGACIECGLPEHNPGVSVIWSKGDSPDNVRIPVFLDSASIYATDDGKLCFFSFQESNAGWYICYARNIINTGGTTITKYSAAFEVASQPEVSEVLASEELVAVAPENQVALLNQAEVTLKCFFFSSSEIRIPSISWRRLSPPGASLPDLSEQKDHNQLLVLRNIQLEDAGEYECYNAFTRSSAMVEVRAPPTWVQELSDVTGNIYESLVLECEAESPDSVTYTWYVNAVVVADQPGIQLGNGLRTLTFQNLTTEHTGMYQCKASNDYGIIYTTSQVVVLAIAPYFKEELKQDQSAPRGGEVTIECKPTASPTPMVSWTKGSQAITTDGHYTVMPNGNLMISDVADSDAGEYTCTATNSQGVGASTGSLVIRDGTAISESPVTTTINEGETGTLTCQATYDPFFDLQYVWFKDGIQVDTSLPNYEQPEIATGEASRLILLDATLDLGGEYTCNAVTSIDEASTAAAVVTIRGQPGPPAGVKAEINGLNANVSWSAGADNNSPITSYIIEGSTDHVPEWHLLAQDISPSRSHYRVKKLSGWSQYKFRVIAVNEVGPGEPSEETAELATAEGRPTMEPSNVGGGGGNEGDLRITWTAVPMKDWNAPDLVYVVMWKQEGQEGVEQAEVSGTEDTYTASGVPAYTLYQVRIQVKNSRGDGPMTEWQQVYSYQMSPEQAPTGLTAVPQMASSILVSWTGIGAADVVGELQGYKIKHWPADSTEELGSIQTVSGEMTEAVVENLEPATQYSLRVLAYSGGGDGPLSDTLTVTTLKSAPMQAPGGVMLSTDGKSSITIKWNAITTSASEEPLVGYKVLYWPKGNFEADAMVKEVDKATTEVTISGLENGKSYLVKVLGYSSGGDGVTSDPVKEVKIAKVEKPSSRSGASVVTATALIVSLPLLVAFHLR